MRLVFKTFTDNGKSELVVFMRKDKSETGVKSLVRTSHGWRQYTH